MTRTALWKSAFLIAAPMALALALLALASPAGAQQAAGEGSRIPPIDITATYTAEHAKISPSGDCGCFWLQGGSGEANVYLYRGLSVAAELTGSRVGNVTPGVDISQIAVMGAQGAVNILYRRELASADDPEELRAAKTAEYEDTLANPYAAAERGYLDAVIRPAETRAQLTRALLSLATKRETLPPKKHGNIPL